MVIQACQGYDPDLIAQSSSPEHIDANSANPNEERHIEMTRPHSLLLMSTLAGGMAVRGAFTGALGSQIAKVDGITPLRQMIESAIIEMENKYPRAKGQTPEERSTLMKRLILPPIHQMPQCVESNAEPSTEEIIHILTDDSQETPV